ncbi:MAG: hypothetical protein K2X86_05025 [Cytophagaceae bacterium]|nr:hypothetical protein [Cytophagaceae bacterium]
MKKIYIIIAIETVLLIGAIFFGYLQKVEADKQQMKAARLEKELHAKEFLLKEAKQIAQEQIKLANEGKQQAEYYKILAEKGKAFAEESLKKSTDKIVE